MRIGFGYDLHRLVPGRKLVVGGVTIPSAKGLLGHSDADVLTHALCDALLGAAGLGDIGMHFPDSDPAFKNIDSLKLLSRTGSMVRANGFEIQNVDATLLAETPQFSPFRESMQRTLAGTLDLDAKVVNVKATTMEGLGCIGREEGIAAMCMVLLRPASP